jgi:hypothetical protein
MSNFAGQPFCDFLTNDIPAASAVESRVVRCFLRCSVFSLLYSRHVRRAIALPQIDAPMYFYPGSARGLGFRSSSGCLPSRLRRLEGWSCASFVCVQLRDDRLTLSHSRGLTATMRPGSRDGEVSPRSFTQRTKLADMQTTYLQDENIARLLHCHQPQQVSSYLP